LEKNLLGKGDELFDALLKITLEELESCNTVSSKIRIVLGDSPTKRYGRKVPVTELATWNLTGKELGRARK